MTSENSKANPGRLYLEVTVVHKGGQQMTVVYSTVHALQMPQVSELFFPDQTGWLQ